MSHFARLAFDARQHSVTNRTVIAITGLAGAGKTTAAMHLVNAHGFERVRFAGSLKAMLVALGLTAEEIDGARKEVPCELLCGKTPRHAMQTIGTEWGRDLIGEDLWIRAWRTAVNRTLPGSCIVVDACRFPNEADAVRAISGHIVRVERAGAGAWAAGHASEQHVLSADRIIVNDGPIDRLFREMDEIAATLTCR